MRLPLQYRILNLLEDLADRALIRLFSWWGMDLDQGSYLSIPHLEDTKDFRDKLACMRKHPSFPKDLL